MTQILVAGARIEAGQGVYIGKDGRAYPIDSDKPKDWHEAVEKMIDEYNRLASATQASASCTNWNQKSVLLNPENHHCS